MMLVAVIYVHYYSRGTFPNNYYVSAAAYHHRKATSKHGSFFSSEQHDLSDGNTGL